MLLRRSLLVLCLLCGGCAWTNRANRPVWNAFEEHMVPDDDGAFFATLPLTVPGGVAAIVADTFVAHPVNVADDAWRDAADVWDGMQWREHYYTELASLPVRAIVTPIAFVGSFLGRSLFNVGPHHSEAQTVTLAARRERDLIRWFERLAEGGFEAYPHIEPGHWNEQLQVAFDRARGHASAHGRFELYRYAQRRKLPPWRAEPEMGLRDRDPVVRYRILEHWSSAAPASRELRDVLLADPNEAVRELARRTWSALR